MDEPRLGAAPLGRARVRLAGGRPVRRAALTSLAASGPVAPADVHVGQDGWLFWIGRPEVILPLYRYRPATWRRLRHWRRLIDARVERAGALGAAYRQVIVPDKLSVYDHRLGAPLVDGRKSPGLRLGRAVSRRHPDVWIDLVEPFRERRDREALFLRTDTHWSRAGYLLGYRLLCAGLGVAAKARVLRSPFETLDAVRDIGNKFDPPISEVAETLRFKGRAVRSEENDLVTFRERQPSHVVGTSAGSRIVLRNPAAGIDQRRVVVFGDSYTFHGTGLGPMLAETFAEVHLVWSSPIDWGLVERVRPDILVHELAERFLFRLPVDDIDIDAYAADRLAEARRLVGENGPGGG